MNDYLSPDYAFWCDLLLALAVGVAVIVGLAALAEGMLRSAVWRRTTWQIAMTGLLVLLLVELTGMGPLPARLCSTWSDADALDAGANTNSGPRLAPAQAAELFLSDDRIIASQRTVTPSLPHLPARRSTRIPTDHPADLARAFEIADATEPAAGSLRLPDEAIPVIGWSVVASPAVSSAPPCAMASKQGPDKGVSSATSHLPVWPAVIWIVGAVWFAGRFAHARWLLQRFQRTALPQCDEDLCRRVSALSGQLGIRRAVRVLRVAGGSSPVAFGCLRPTIALPASFSEDYDRPQQNAVLAHELAHLSACDQVWHQAANLLCATLWWHPLVWWMRRRLQAASEAAADEASLLVPGGPDALAACLVSLGRRLQPSPRLGWLSVEGDRFRSGLGRRVQRLLRLQGRPWRAPSRRGSLPARMMLPLVAALVAVSCTAWVRPQAAFSEGVTTMNMLTGSWRNSLAATVLLALVGSGGDAAADDPQADSPPGATAAENSVEQPPLQAMLEGDREEGEARRREDRERRDAEVREHEERERHGAEIREREERERHEAEVREREEQRRREQERRQEELLQHREELREHATELKRRMSQLRDDEDDAAREIREQLRRISEEIREVERRLRGDDRPRGDRGRGDADERGQLARQIDQLHEQIRSLVEAGRHEAAERLENHLRELVERLEGRRDERRPEPPEEVQRRIEHLEVAIDNLHAAGLHDQAEGLVQEIERLHRGDVERDRPRPERPDRRGDRPRDDQGRAVAELREEVQRLRGEMDEMRGLLQELLERSRRDEDGPRRR